MGVPFGYNTVLGFGEESTFGVGVASDAFLEINSESLVLEEAPIEQPKLSGAGVRDYVLSKRMVSGGLDFALPYEGAELMLKQITGGTPSSVQVGVTTAFRTTFPFSDNRYPGLSLNIGRDSAAVGTAFRYTGMQPTKLTLSAEIESHIKAQVDFVGKDEELIAAETPTYPYPNFVNWNQMTVLKIGGVDILGKMTEFDIEDPAADDRFTLLSRLRRGIGRGAARKVSGKIEVEFEYTATYLAFRNQKEVEIEATWIGPVIEAGVNYELSIIVPRAVLGGSTPNAGDMGPLVHEFSFQGFEELDGGDEMRIELVNTIDMEA